MTDIIASVLGIVLLVIVVGLFMSIPVWILWNWLMPDIFNLSRITFFQALGLSLLSSCLFKNSTSSGKKD
jgi:hypothetical protein